MAASLCFAAVALAEESVPPPNILIVEASQLIRAAEDARAPEEKIPLLEDARGKLQSVIDNHPASDLALKLATGQSIGAISLPAVDRALETALEGCWTSPTVDCVSRLVLDHAESSGDCEIQLGAYRALADASIALENFEKADSAMKRVEELDGSCDAYGFQSSVAVLPSIVARDLSGEQLARVTDLVAQDFMPDSQTLGLMRGLGENGFLSTATEIAEALSGYSQDQAHIELALARGKHDLREGAGGTESFSKAKRIAAEVEADDPRKSAELLARIAWEQVKSNAATDALATVNAVEELAQGLVNERPLAIGDVQPLVKVLVDVAHVKARAAGNKTDAMPVLLRAMDLASRSSRMSVTRLAYNTLWFAAAGARVPESLLRLTAREMRADYSESPVFFEDFSCEPWAAVHSAYGRLGDPISAFRRLEAELSRMGFEWKNRGETFNCVGNGMMTASLIEVRHDSVPITFGYEGSLIFSLLDIFQAVPDYPLDRAAVAIIVNWRSSDYLLRAIEHQFEAGFTRQARSLAQQATDISATGSGWSYGHRYERIVELVRFQLLFGMPSQAEALLRQELASWREDCLTASAEDDCHSEFRHLLTSAAILEGATAR